MVFFFAVHILGRGVTMKKRYNNRFKKIVKFCSKVVDTSENFAIIELFEQKKGRIIPLPYV